MKKVIKKLTVRKGRVEAVKIIMIEEDQNPHLSEVHHVISQIKAAQGAQDAEKSQNHQGIQTSGTMIEKGQQEKSADRFPRILRAIRETKR